MRKKRDGDQEKLRTTPTEDSISPSHPTSKSKRRKQMDGEEKGKGEAGI